MKRRIAMLVLVLLALLYLLTHTALAEAGPGRYHWHISSEGEKRLLIDPDWFCHRLESMGYTLQQE